MTSLPEFLLARLDEDEAAIRDGWDSDGRARVASMWVGGEAGYTTVAADQGDGVWVADGREVVDARHVQVLFDPARVLADVEARRRIVEGILDATMDGRESRMIGPFMSTDDILGLLALPYADHPDYRPEWKP